jgi:hypothetical protein
VAHRTASVCRATTRQSQLILGDRLTMEITNQPITAEGCVVRNTDLYVEMPAPGWGIQLVYTDPGAPDLSRSCAKAIAF